MPFATAAPIRALSSVHIWDSVRLHWFGCVYAFAFMRGAYFSQPACVWSLPLWWGPREGRTLWGSAGPPDGLVGVDLTVWILEHTLVHHLINHPFVTVTV
jgi:hypothetical protein